MGDIQLSENRYMLDQKVLYHDWKPVLELHSVHAKRLDQELKNIQSIRKGDNSVGG